MCFQLGVLSTYPQTGRLLFVHFSGIAEQQIITVMEQFTVWVTIARSFGHISVIHSVFPFILCFVSNPPSTPLISLFLLSPPLSFGSLGICFFFFFCKFGTGPNPNQMFNRRHPKYMKAHSALRPAHGAAQRRVQRLSFETSVWWCRKL